MFVFSIKFLDYKLSLNTFFVSTRQPNKVSDRQFNYTQSQFSLKNTKILWLAIKGSYTAQGHNMNTFTKKQMVYFCVQLSC